MRETCFTIIDLVKHNPNDVESDFPDEKLYLKTAKILVRKASDETLAMQDNHGHIPMHYAVSFLEWYKSLSFIQPTMWVGSSLLSSLLETLRRDEVHAARNRLSSTITPSLTSRCSENTSTPRSTLPEPTRNT
jgi:hypothetical protein